MVKGSYYIKYLSILVFIVSYVGTYAQNCTIKSVDDACLGEIVNFTVNSAQTPLSYQWKFGDGSTSTQPKPSYTYTTHNTFNVEVTLTFPDGTSCTVTKNVIIHPRPVSDFTIDPTNIYCLSKNKICIDDISTPGPTGNPIVSRVFLWGDGAGDNTSNPAAQKKLCHSFAQAGTYSLLMETTDNKGCQSKNNKTVVILPDFKVAMSDKITVSNGDCKYSICLENTTSPFDSTLVEEIEWNFGDGYKVVSLDSLKLVCHNYTVNGNYIPYLKIKHKSGCVDSVTTSINVKNPQFNFNLEVPDTLCLGDVGTFLNNASNPGAEYRWFVKDSSIATEDVIPDQTNPVNYTFDKPGNFRIKLNLLNADSCARTVLDTVIVKGPAAEFQIRNRKLCTVGDTSYFCDASNYYRAYNVKRIWDFEHGAQCTTNTKNNINVGANCRYSVDVNPKHFYTHTGAANKFSCFRPTLKLKDTITGCESEAAGQVFLGLPPLDALTIRDTAIEYCTDIGSQDDDRIVTFFIDGIDCNQSWDLLMNFDSARGIDRFQPVSPSPPPISWYQGVADPDGWVTIGFIVRNGDTTRYSSCTGQLPVSGNFCADTVWHHRKFQLAEVPNPFTQVFQQKVCAPFNHTLRPEDTVQTTIAKMVWDWGDGTKDSLIFGPNDSIVPSRSHGYTKNGLYTQVITMYNSKGCKEEQVLTLGVGFQNFAAFDSVVCAGDSIEIREFISYYDKADKLWQDSVRNAEDKEQVRWDFGDGNFVYKKPETKVVFPQKGIYKIRMASKDSTGCRDTFSFEIRAVEAEAFIRDMRDTFYCNDNIVRFYDSSFGSPDIPGDVVTQWQWTFGDGQQPSFLKDPFHFYSSFGRKEVVLSIISKEGCRDTARKIITIVGPEPFFEIITDSIGCNPHTVTFKNTSNRVRTWIWNLGDANNTSLSTNRDTSITFTYTPPGTYNITLYGADSIFNPLTGNTYFCEATYPDTPLVKQVIVIPNHPVGIDIPDTVCQNTAFTVKSTAGARYDRFRWWMGNGDSVFTDSVQFQYEYTTVGNYRVDFKPTYTPTALERLCILDTFKDITVIPITADFEINPSSRAPIFSFTNTSQDAIRYEWDFGQPSSGRRNRSTAVNPSHNYKLELGTFTVCLIAYNKEGCPDTVCKQVTNDYVPRLFIPNVFTPNGIDTLNNRFDIDIFLPLQYKLSIYNRWGEKVFEGTEDGEGNSDVRNWDGIHYKTGESCPSGVYYVVFDYEILGTDEVKQYSGTLTLFRKSP